MEVLLVISVVTVAATIGAMLWIFDDDDEEWN